MGMPVETYLVKSKGEPEKVTKNVHHG